MQWILFTILQNLISSEQLNILPITLHYSQKKKYLLIISKFVFKLEISY